MPGYPVAHDKADPWGKTRSYACPYSPQEMREYLHNCHYHWSRDEEPMEFGQPVFSGERKDETRNMWLWQCDDPLGRKWWIVIGSGRSPMGAQIWRWMYAQTNESYETPAIYLNHAWRDIEEHL
jgi:hypothetical protein